MKDYRRLDVWAKAHALTLSVYRETRSFPSDERFGLTSQIRRAAVSVPSNIAEGRGRSSDAEFARFLHIAAGSLNELEYQCILSKELGYLALESADRLIQECADVRRMLAGLLQSLSQSTGTSVTNFR
ncbi:conserved hypothetical protein [Thiocapsa sp. KS1]|nr:four helix bundle protein [Thiocapsa sp. KS1]CRI66451.1 conserved hypothetical protein [Thiocapsa sp. KS1]